MNANLERKFDKLNKLNNLGGGAAKLGLTGVTVRVPQFSSTAALLYGTYYRAVYAYVIAYEPERIVMSSDYGKQMLSEERALLASRNGKTLRSSSVSLQQEIQASSNAEEKKYLEHTQVHVTRHNTLTSSARLSPPEDGAGALDLFCKLVAESHMAAFLYDYVQVRFYGGVPVLFEPKLFVARNNIMSQPDFGDLTWSL